MFTNRLLRESTLVAKKHSSRMIEHFTKKCNEKENKGSISVDIQDMFFRLTMDIFTFIAFGEDLDSVTRKEPHAFATAFDTVPLFSSLKFFTSFFFFQSFVSMLESNACAEIFILHEKNIRIFYFILWYLCC
jgi:hypothetical protein